MRRIPFLVLTVLLFSCDKDNEKDVQAPSIDIQSPFDQQVTAPGETIAIAGMVEDNYYLKMVHVEIRDVATEEMVCICILSLLPKAMRSMKNLLFNWG